jgi:hypothetical protein
MSVEGIFAVVDAFASADARFFATFASGVTVPVG